MTMHFVRIYSRAHPQQRTVQLETEVFFILPTLDLSTGSNSHRQQIVQSPTDNGIGLLHNCGGGGVLMACQPPASKMFHPAIREPG